MITIVYGVALLLSSLPRLEQSAYSPAPAAKVDCRQALLKACRKINPAQSSRTVAHMQFTSRTVFSMPDQNKLREVLTSASFYAQGNKLYFETPQTALWQDGQYIATVMRSQRIIYLTRVDNASKNQRSPVQFAMLRDSLVQRAQVLNCQTIKDAAGGYQQVELTPAVSDQARYHISSLSFKLDPQANIKEIAVIYPIDSQVRKVIYTIAKQEVIASSAKIPASARAKVVDKNNRPLPAYQGYQVVDHTKLSRIPY